MSAKEILDAMQARCDAATKGPWSVDGWQIVGPGIAPPGEVAIDCKCQADHEDEMDEEYHRPVAQREADMAFAAAARADLPLLLRVARMVADELCDGDMVEPSSGQIVECGHWGRFCWPCRARREIEGAVG